MNTLELKDVLHYYLGCECMYDGEIGIMYECDTHGVRLQNVFSGGHMGHRFVKPILRPLSDMTEEEKRCIKNKVHGDAKNILPDIPFAQYFVSYTNKEAEITHYLLSKHFDLFGLINRGLAIDKTKVGESLKPVKWELRKCDDCGTEWKSTGERCPECFPL